MASVINNHHTALKLSDGTILKPGVATNVRNWDEAVRTPVVAMWVKRGVLTVDGGDASAADEKAQIRARLDELGVEYKKNLGLVKLRELLAEVDVGEG